MLLYHYKQLTPYISEVERIENRVNSKKKEWSTMKKKEEEGEERTFRFSAGLPSNSDNFHHF
jgi:hypothetical protein